ncbi:ATP-binding cassette domain-containing protein [Streptomyces sediminimaris]|uniref:ATP-binding cassette domain-containing protein n=1 Tax=Streptomyces sediminimaris TaxID=3383721 RepID=UPI00399B0533
MTPSEGSVLGAGDLSGPAIEVEGLVKSFGQYRALREVNLRVPAGSVVCVLGRNGAGKTTTVRILTTLIRPDAGRALVAGHDIATEPERVRARIGVAWQGASLDQVLTGRQNLRLMGRFHHLGARGADRRAEELLEQFGMTYAADKPVGTYSGGMRRRLDLAVSLLPEPQVLFLDEPTTGLDPISRTDTWQIVRDVAGGGTAVLLTTQDMEEASALADVIVVLAGGRVLLEGTPSELTAAAGLARVRVTLPESRPELVGATGRALGPSATVAGRVVTVPAPKALADLAAVVERLRRHGIEVHDVGLEHPTLAELYAELTAEPAGRHRRTEPRPGPKAIGPGALERV